MQHQAIESEAEAHQLSVFLVEDETLILMMVAEMIEEMGHTVVAEASNIKQALSLAQTANFDIAILDVNLGGERIDPVAEVISRRNLPFIVASGYGAAAAEEHFRGRPILQKPFISAKLADVIEAALQASGAAEAPRDV
jgi:DNA-binding NtrC family response regulator